MLSLFVGNFQITIFQLTEAYEVLSSDEKRKAYDKECQENCAQTSSGSWPTQKVEKKFEDLGLDYKTFEDFQRNVNSRSAIFTELCLL